MFNLQKVFIVVILLIIMFIPSVVGAVELTDITGHWAEDDIRELVGMGAITGYPDGTYGPEGTITRAEFSSVLRGAMGLAEVPGTTFPDTIGHWGEGRIEALVQAGVIDTGLYGQNYSPDGSITREEIAMMTVLMLGDLTGATDIPFLDRDQIGTGYNAYVAEAYARGIVKGYPDDTFRPKGTATRAEAAVMAIRALRISGAVDVDEEVEEPSETIPTIVSFTTDFDSLIAGSTATLSWEVSDAVTVTVDHNIGEVDQLSGSYDVSPAETTTYTLTAANSAGSDTAEVTITVTSLIHDPLPNGIIIPPPSIVDFSADKSGMTKGISATLSWEVSGIATVTIEPDIGEVSKSGTYVQSPTETTTYTLTAGNVSGSTTETVTIKVRPALIIRPGPGEGKDSYVNSYFKNDNNGDRIHFNAGLTPSGTTMRAFIQFDALDNLSDNVVIENADLMLYLRETLTAEVFNIGVHAVLESWGEDNITWNNQPSYASATESTSAIVPGEASCWITWDIASLVQKWVDGSIPNYGMSLNGMSLIAGEGLENIAYFNTSEYTANPALRPQLVLTYYVP